EYNPAAATLWFFEAIRQYYAATDDRKLLRGLFALLADIVDRHLRGARHNIHVDPTDGLLYAGEPGVQVTWMDAKAGNWVVTPRIGKPVEVNALWYNALLRTAEFARAIDKPPAEYEHMAAQARANFRRFWSPTMGCCFDVIDGPGGDDASLRPNQLLAVSFLEPIANHLKSHGLGSVSEIFDGDPPFTPRGAIAQAWSVAEVLRAWAACHTF